MKRCKDCPDYKKCTSLCPKIESWVNQDEITWSNITITDKIDKVLFNEFIYGGDDLCESDWAVLIDRVSFTPRQKKYLYEHYWKNKSMTDIAKEYGVSRQAISFTVKKGKERIRRELNA